MLTINEIFIYLFSGSLLAGLLGALSGLGGGIVVVPLLVILLNVDIHYAIGTSLIAVIATSTGASSAYVKEGFTNIRIGLFLETATSIGAILGVAFGSLLPASALYILFGIFLVYSAITAYFGNKSETESYPENKLSKILKLDGKQPLKEGTLVYQSQNIPLGYLIMFIAGNISGILGIGSGALKVLAMDKVMKLPFKVSTTTSNFMIGVTAATSAGIYLKLGYIDPILTAPVMVGVTVGSLIGARLLPEMKVKTLRYIFIFSILLIALQMIHMGMK